MGSSQLSSFASENRRLLQVNEQLVAQVHALQMRQEHAVEREYVHVEKGMASPKLHSSGLALSLTAAKEWERRLLADSKNKLALSALLSNPVDSLVTEKIATRTDAQVFNVTIPFEGGPITNQRSSGRCWLFAATNIFRLAVMKKHNLKELELSQSYLFFWDKLEKANWFLTQIMETADEDLGSRLVQKLLHDSVQDGGQWDFAVNVVKKYGLVPQKLYPDSYHAMSSSKMDTIITTKLRGDALRLRSLINDHNASESKLAAVKANMMQEVYGILTLMLGPPPKPDQEFDWEFYDADQKYRKVRKTPLALANELTAAPSVRSLNFNLDTMFCLVHDPRHDPLTHLTVHRSGNVVGGRDISYTNVSMATMKRAAIKMLKAGVPVFFGSDVGKFAHPASGILDPKLYDYELLLNVKLNMDKKQRMISGESQMTHAMVLTAVHVDDDGNAVRWRVENSWGTDAGDQGWFVMSDDWMDEFCFQIVVDPAYVEKEVRDVKKQEAMVLPLWDPLGALAK